MNAQDIVEQVKKEIADALKANDFSQIDSALSRKRISWLRNNIHLVSEPSPVKKAYILLMRKMEVNLSEVPIVHEDAKKIVWRSHNWCPVLEACKQLGLDTREICKKGWEQSVDQFVKGIHPRLRFSRNYRLLRPHSDFCEETIELLD